MERRESHSFVIILCLVLGILIGSLGTYYVLSVNYTSKINELKREIKKKEDKITELEAKEEKELEPVDITSKQTKTEYNKILNSNLKSILSYFNFVRTTYDDTDFTDIEMAEATCYYLKSNKEETFEKENNTEEKKVITFDNLNPFIKQLFGVELNKDELDDTLFKDNKLTCQYQKDMKDVLYKVTKVVNNQEEELIEITYDDISPVLENEEKKEEVETLKKNDNFDYEKSDVKAKYELILKKISENEYQIVKNKKI